ncbi:D-alanyl-D-alanine carboxypeptidase/D-alanyl-D-alanine-endopeptidase [Agreia pratensis]|uniref:D-alanyl-D-alanine carboxypeptidase / D-alanyl-D-alanine-endopeptidase (Penicillin-binding protein 4) n=1 Tax=Agreia pratensis TaxID=150121 RepID=A0A1X7IG86_9MICO|nr:D-alanyl-D-alanine carboxypeptidase [Agreia pratensis]SMG13412.1 D-alanyl-D-alanine carboxypeptidase / D-alanyl-D-alanine-endopeptidase (penicillin-binding protein 4) [Agreia pratensis]
MSEKPVPEPRPALLSGIVRRARAHPRAFAATAAAAALVVLGGGGLLAGAFVGTPNVETVARVSAPPSATPTVTSTPTPTPEARSVPAAVTPAQPVRTCSIAEAASDSRLGTFSGSVRNATTGEILYDHGGGTYSRTASVMKVLTSAAALAVLGPDYRASTTVVAGTQPGQVVLVGGGDITLASGSSNIYPGAASMLDLAAQVTASLGGTPVTSIVLDSSAFAGDAWQPSWNRKELFDGWSSEVTALQVDGDRADPSSSQSTRSEDPIGRAGAAFASALGATGAPISQGVAPAGAATLGTVQSAPVSTMVQDALLRSDNTEAEMLARLTAIAQGSGNTFSALGASTPAALATYGLDTAGLVIVDGSGLSDDNGVSPNFLTALFAKIAAREGNLGIIADGLPVAGESGTLGGRFTGSNSDAAGHVIAKTGWIDTGYTLSGIIQAADGSVLTFAFFALDDVSDSSKQALDTITAAAYRCGNNLSNQ